VLSRYGIQGWEDQYSFLPDDVRDEEIEAANRWTATDPASRFVGHVFVSIALPEGYAAMTDRRLTVHDGAWSSSDEIATPEEYRTLLRTRFGISLSALDVAQLRLFAH
jgi:N-hydroxyarylamine O-acetyltransferase